MLLTKFQRYDEIEFLSDRFVARVADQFLRAVVPKLNNAVLVGNDDRVLNSFFTRLRLPGRFLELTRVSFFASGVNEFPKRAQRFLHPLTRL